LYHLRLKNRALLSCYFRLHYLRFVHYALGTTFWQLIVSQSNFVREMKRTKVGITFVASQQR